MRKIIVSTFMSMDGVMQAPGGPDEDRRGGFEWGGWIVPHWDEIAEKEMGGIMSRPFDLLLGHRTYEIFAAHWPYQDDQIGSIFNKIKKYVVANHPVDLSWENSIQVSGDIVTELEELKKSEGPDLFVNGSSKLVQTLLANNLIDTFHLWIMPITLGKGRKIFEEGTIPADWKLTGSTVSKKGVIIASYEPCGEIKTGSFTLPNPSKAELERRERWKAL